MYKNLKNKTEGFTIIEVLIVLAIAGLILLVVFLAVPALQRNSRNTQRNSDASRVAAAVNNWVSNNNGKVFVAGASNANITAVINDTGSLGQYSLTTSNFTVGVGANAAIANTTDMKVMTGAKCGDNGISEADSASTRKMVLLYGIEGGSGTTGRCINI